MVRAPGMGREGGERRRDGEGEGEREGEGGGRVREWRGRGREGVREGERGSKKSDTVFSDNPIFLTEILMLC